MTFRRRKTNARSFDQKTLQALGIQVKGVKQRAHCRHTPGVMNQTEKSFANYLNELKLLGSVVWWMFEPMNLRLAEKKCFLQIDFMVANADRTISMIDVKGSLKYAEDDAIVKMKVAAQTFWMFEWQIVVPKKVGGWERINYGTSFDTDLETTKSSNPGSIKG